MGYGWNWDRCAAMAMAAGPEETLVSGYWSTVAQRSLWMPLDENAPEKTP